MHSALNFILNQPSSTYTTILSYLGGSTAVAAVLQVVKHKLNIAEAKKLVTFLLALFSFIAAFADYILQTTAQNPLALGRNTGYIIAGAVFVHRFVVSPSYDKLVNGLGGLVKDAATYRASIAPQSTTAGENPAEPVSPVEVQTFSV